MWDKEETVKEIKQQKEKSTVKNNNKKIYSIFGYMLRDIPTKWHEQFLHINVFIHTLFSPSFHHGFPCTNQAIKTERNNLQSTSKNHVKNSRCD